MQRIPDERIQEAFVAPTSEIIRRIEIYESDAVTPWKQALWGDILIGGSVSASYGDGERRTFECTLDNYNGELNPVPGGMWYDKVFKVFYGIKLNQRPRMPRILIVEEDNAPMQFIALKSMLNKQGFKTVHYNPQAEFYDEVEDFDILVSISSTSTKKLALLNEAFTRGKSVMTFSPRNTVGTLPGIIASTGNEVAHDGPYGFAEARLDHDIMLDWAPWTMAQTPTYRRINSVTAGATVLASVYDDTNGLSPGIIVNQVFGGARWFHMQQYQFKLEEFDGASQEFYDNCAALIGRAAAWVDTYVPLESWECQIGEFISDSIQDEQETPGIVKVTGRDYVKRCMKSKFSKATTFAKTLQIEDVIRSVASNAGITKFDLPLTNTELGKDMTWERDTERWQVMYDIAEAHNYELYFDAEGYLTMRKFRDPSTSAPTLLLRTGPGGNLISRGAKTTDGELYNHVTVVGESSDSSIPLVFGEAINNDPNSPSRVGDPGQPGGIGDRVKNVTSSVITSSLQAQELARSLLAVSGLEEFELNFSSVLFPWIEPGDILEMVKSDDNFWAPSRYLISSISLPLDLSPMSGTGKRVTNVA